LGFGFPLPCDLLVNSAGPCYHLKINPTAISIARILLLIDQNVFGLDPRSVSTLLPRTFPLILRFTSPLCPIPRSRRGPLSVAFLRAPLLVPPSGLTLQSLLHSDPFPVKVYPWLLSCYLWIYPLPLGPTPAPCYSPVYLRLHSVIAPLYLCLSVFLFPSLTLKWLSPLSIFPDHANPIPTLPSLWPSS
jgi:hypothetical protein